MKWSGEHNRAARWLLALAWFALGAFLVIVAYAAMRAGWLK